MGQCLLPTNPAGPNCSNIDELGHLDSLVVHILRPQLLPEDVYPRPASPNQGFKSGPRGIDSRMFSEDPEENREKGDS